MTDFSRRAKPHCDLLKIEDVTAEKTRTVRGSDYIPAIALSGDKDIFSNCDATLQKMILYNPNVDLVNDNVYTKCVLNKYIRSQDI